MAILYFIAVLPIIIGGILWACSKQVNWIEWAGGGAAAIAIAGMFHLIGVYAIPGDVQTYSGQIIEAKHFTAWKEYYEEAVYRTETYKDSNGDTQTREVFDHWESETRWHDEHWKFYSNIETEYDISKSVYQQAVKLFGGKEIKVEGVRRTSEHASKMIAGDPHDRSSTPINGYVWPVTSKRSWSNRVKVGPSVYSFVKVPATVPVFDWPDNPDPFVSNRLLGTAAHAVSTYEWDKLNAQLGPNKKVNLIAIGFGEQDSSIAQYQRAKYIGGKKNDLVICYGGDNKKPNWVVVFGWTDSELVKQNLQTLILENGFTPAILPEIKNEVWREYKIKDWSAFDHIEIPPTTSLIVWYLVCIVITQGGLYVWFHRNEFGEGGLTSRQTYRRF